MIRKGDARSKPQARGLSWHVRWAYAAEHQITASIWATHGSRNPNRTIDAPRGSMPWTTLHRRGHSTGYAQRRGCGLAARVAFPIGACAWPRGVRVVHGVWLGGGRGPRLCDRRGCEPRSDDRVECTILSPFGRGLAEAAPLLGTGPWQRSGFAFRTNRAMGEMPPFRAVLVRTKPSGSITPDSSHNENRLLNHLLCVR